jgi:uncharacterized damage-inducible protein DinB
MAPDDLIARLSAAPRRLTHAVEGLSADDLRATPAAGEWSVAQVLAHLRASDDILAYRVYCMLARDDPRLPGYDERRWADVAGYTHAPEPARLLDAYAARRSELVMVLRTLAPADWRRGGHHEEHGALTITDVVTHLVAHEEEHCAQIEQLVVRSRRGRQP